MIELPAIPAMLETGDRTPGEGGMYQRTPKRQPDAEQPKKPPVDPINDATTEAKSDPVAPLVEQLERLRATHHDHAPSAVEPDSRRFQRVTAAYRDANQAAALVAALHRAVTDLAADPTLRPPAPEADPEPPLT
jgi:hypothetical protein